MDYEGQFRLSQWEPREWFVVFHRQSSRWWVKWLAWGEFEHVSLLGYVAPARIWLHVDVMASRTAVFAVPDETANAMIGILADSGVVVRMPAPDFDDRRLRLKPGLWCVPSVAHVLGLKTCALRPDRLLRQCLANGGTIVVDDSDEFRRRRDRSGAGAPAAGGEG